MKNMTVLNRYSLIITILCVLFTSCVPPKSVRPTGSYLTLSGGFMGRKGVESAINTSKFNQNNSKGYSNREQNNENSQSYTEEAITGLVDSVSYTPNFDENIMNELPTLNQQLRYISANQIEIQNDLAQVKNILNDLENRITKLEKNQKTKDNLDNRFENIILPDEIVNNSKNNSKQRRNISLNSKKNPKKVNNSINFQEQIEEIKSILKQRDYSKAINELQQIVRNTKDTVTINLCYFYLGESHYGLKQYDKAINYYKKVAYSGDAKISDDALVKIAEANVNLGYLSEAKKFFKELVKRFPKSENVPYARKMLQKI